MAKYDDENLTGEMVNQMSRQELKHFENRLRYKAGKLNFKAYKSHHPVYGANYALIDENNEVEVSGVDLCELKEYLYSYENEAD